jgi:plasmid maintenance system antidote protein VapI
MLHVNTAHSPHPMTEGGSMLATADTAAEIRAELARRQMTRYHLAALVQIHPSRLGMMINGKLPLPVAVAARISEALGRREAPTG